MLPLADIARLEEHRCALGTSEVALESMPIAGGIASRGDPGTWVNTAVGLGLDGPVTRADLARLVAWYESAGHTPQVEVAPYADATLVAELGHAGFRATSFEQVMFRPLAPGERFDPPRPVPQGISIVRVDRAETPRIREAAAAIAAAFAPEGAAPRPEDIALVERCARHPRSTLFAAYAGGTCAGGGFLEILGELASLYFLAVAGDFRRRGIQQALIAARLTAAASRGCTLATISGPPGMGTERNVRRAGFQVGYTRITFRKVAPTGS